MATLTPQEALSRALKVVRDTEALLVIAEDKYDVESHEECTLHNNLLRGGADRVDEQVRHEVEITRLRAPLDAARARVANAIDDYWRAYRLI